MKKSQRFYLGPPSGTIMKIGEAEETSEQRHCFLCRDTSRFTYSRASYFPDFLLVTYSCPGCHPKMIGMDRDFILNLLCLSDSDQNGRSGPYSSARELYD